MFSAKNILNIANSLTIRPALREALSSQFRTITTANYRNLLPVSKSISNSTRTYVKKWPEQWPIDVRFEWECRARKCRNLPKTPDYGLMHCTKTPELNTPENRARYCRDRPADTYDCYHPPRNKGRQCVLKCRIYMPNESKCVPKSGGDCGRKFYSTRASVTDRHVVEDQKHDEDIFDGLYYQDEQGPDEWEGVPSLIFKRDYNQKVFSKWEKFRAGKIFKHFHRNRRRMALTPFGIRKYSTLSAKNNHQFTVRNNLSHSVQRVIKFFKARPNCPTAEDYRKQKLIQKAQKAAKAAGLQLCSPCTPEECAKFNCAQPKPTPEAPQESQPKIGGGCDLKLKCEPVVEKKSEPKVQPEPKAKSKPKVQSEPPPKKANISKTPQESKAPKVCKKKNLCPKICMPGCKPPADRLFCKIDDVKFDCKKMETPYASFSELKTWEFARPRSNECTCQDDFRLMREMRKMKTIPKQVKYSTFAPLQTSSLNLISKRMMSTISSEPPKKNQDSSKLDDCCQKRPMELCGTCKPMPFKPPCIDLVPGQKPSCKSTLKPPPCPPPIPEGGPPCPIIPKPKPIVRCGLPHRPPECLIDRCKRYRECCREPPKPKVCPCEEPC